MKGRVWPIYSSASAIASAAGVGLAVSAFVLLSLAASGQAQSNNVLTFHNDNARDGQYLVETVLTPANVKTNVFGKLWVLSVDGKVDAEPLYCGDVIIPGKGRHNILLVATEHDSVYAFDADSTNLLWHVSMLGTNETSSDDRSCTQVEPEIGVTATPVIDRQLGPNGTMFVVAMSKNGSTYYQRIHALDLTSGADLIAPKTVTATYPGTGDNTSGGNVVFDPSQYKERPGLLLLNGVVYTAWASHCDNRPYTGWIISYNETNLAQISILNVTPNGNEGAIWMAGDGPAADTNGNIYFLDANGEFDSTFTTNGFPTEGDYGNAFMKLSTTSNVLAVADYFGCFTNNTYENSHDEDLGSGGEILLPDMTNSLNQVVQLAVGAGKDKNIYIVNRNNMGKFNAANNNAIYQEVSGVLSGGVYSTPAYFNGLLYYGAVSDHLKAFPFQNALLGAMSSESSVTFGSQGVTPSISANGTSNGIVWAVNNSSTAVLYAFAATNLAVQLYNSSQLSSGKDQFGAGNKFIIPMIANGRVYVGTTNGVGVFGLLNVTPPTPLAITSVGVNASNLVTLNYSTTSNFNYHAEFTSNLPPVSWTVVSGSATDAPGTNVTFTDTNPISSGQRYYRVVTP
jgi:hypothetical protein